MSFSSVQATKQVFIVLFSLLPEAVIDHSLVPLYPYMVRFLLPNEPESNIGFYSGLIGSASHLPLFFMNLVWGSLSDRIGRKPVICIGLFASCFTSFVLGFNKSYSVTVACRFVAGVFGANSTIAKSMLGDISDSDQTRAWAYALYGAIYGVMGIFGTLLGGLLANPAELYPDTFGNSKLLKDYPYLLPCLLGTFLSCVALAFVLVYMREPPSFYARQYQNVRTNEDGETDEASNEIQMEHFTRKRRGPKATPSSPSVKNSSPLLSETMGFAEIPYIRPETPPNEANMKERRFGVFSDVSPDVYLPICMYCTIALMHSMYSTSIPLYFSSKTDGLGFTARETSFFLSAVSACKLFVQILLFNSIMHALGSLRAFRLSIALCIPIHAILALLRPLRGTWLNLLLLLTMVLMGFGESVAFLSVIVLITEKSDKKTLGLTHGLASTAAAGCRFIGPAMAGAIWNEGVARGSYWLVFASGGLVGWLGYVLLQ